MTLQHEAVAIVPVERELPETTSSRASLLAHSVHTGRGVLTWPRVFALLAVAGVIIGVGAASDSMMRYSLVVGTVLGIAILGSNVVTGPLGEINLAGSAYMAFGAYGFAWAMTEGWGFAASLVFAVALGAMLGFLLAIPIVRLSGVFTALTTFALALAIPDLTIYLADYTGGELGITVPTPRMGERPLDTSSMTMLVIVSAVFVLVALISLALYAGPVGRALLTASEAAPAARVFGMQVTLVKVLAWTWTATIGALAGAVYAMTSGFLNTTIFTVFLGVTLLVGGLVGGARSVIGAWLGGLVVGTVPLHIQSVVPAAATGVVFGAVMLLALLTGRGGIVGMVEKAIVRVMMRKAP